MYGNLRLENVMIKLDLMARNSKVKEIKFLNFGICIAIEDSENIHIPDQIDHLPPDMLRHLMKIKRF